MIKYSVKRPYTIFVGIMLIIVLGVVSFLGLNTDLLPSMDLPYVIVQTTYPGASPEKVETTVTRPIEQAVATVSGLENLTSISSENVSIVIMEFNDAVNMDSIMIDLSSNLDMVSGYFDDTVSPPMLIKINPDSLPIQMFTVNYDGMDIKELTTYMEDELQPLLERVEGVATVDISGLVEDRIEIQLNQTKIDTINNKILEIIDSDLYEAKIELEDAKSEINSGIAELDNSKDEAIAGLATASAELDAGIAQAQAMASEKASLEASLNIKKGQLALASAKYEIALAIEMFAPLPDALNSLTINDIILTLTDPIQIGALNQMIASGIVSGTDTLGDIKAMLQSSMAEINSQLAQVAAPPAIINSSDSSFLNTQIATLTQEETSLTQRISEAGLMQQQLESAVSELKTVYAEMEENKLIVTSELAVTEAELNALSSEIEQGLTEFEDARDDALKNANIDSLVTFDALSGILTAQNFAFPAGFVLSETEQLTVKVGDQISDVDELRELTLLDMGLDGLDPITLSDVADITITDNSQDSYVRLNGNPAITISIQKSSVASTSAVSTNMNNAIVDLTEADPNLHIDMLMDQGIYIDLVIDNVMSNLIYGGIIALFVLLLFLKDIRPTAIIGMSIPMSLLFSIVLMYFSNVTLNIISLSGLALGVGMLVDNSIVVIENIYRLRKLGYNRIKAAVVGTSQVGGAIFASTLTTVCVFLPIVFTDGISRQLFTDMGLTIAYSLFASLIVAMTAVPAMSASLLRADAQKEHRLFDNFVNLYEKALKFNLKYKFVVIIATAGLFAFTIFSLFSMPMELFPAMDSTQLQMTLNIPDTDRDDLIDAGENIGESVMAINGVENVSMMYNDGSGFTSSKSITYNIVISEESGLVGSDITDEIRALTSEYEEYITLSTSNMDMTALTGEGISIVIKGNELDSLQEISADIADSISDIEGIADISDGNEQQQQEMRISVDRDKAAKYSLTTAQVFQIVTDALTEETQSTIFTFDSTDMTSFILPTTVATEMTLDDIVVATDTVEVDDDDEEATQEVDILLSDIAVINYGYSPAAINRDNQSRVQTVAVTVDEGYNVSLVSRDVESRLANYTLPDGYSLAFTGENEMIMQTMNDLVLMILLAIVFIYLIMVSQFQSLLSPFIVLFTIPLAFTGGLLALLITGQALSVTSMVGFLVLAGVVVNNGIVFVDYVNKLREEGKTKKEAIIQAGRDRIRPILMTALTTILAMSTMAIGVGMGAEMSQGVALVAIGGLLYSTVLTLFLIPALYDIIYRRNIEKAIDFEEQLNN